MKNIDTALLKKPKGNFNVIEKIASRSFASTENILSNSIIATIFTLCIVVILFIPSTTQITHNLDMPKTPPSDIPVSSSSDKSQSLHVDGDAEFPAIPFLVTKMGPTEITRFPTGDMMLMSVGSSSIENLRTIDGNNPVPADKKDGTSAIPIKKPEVELDQPLYVWGSSVYITFTDPFSVKHSDKIETIGDNHNIIIYIGSKNKLDCVFRETGDGTGFFNGRITLKWPWIFNTKFASNGPWCIDVQDDRTVNQSPSSITVSYEYAKDEFATATSHIQMSWGPNWP